MTDPSLIPDSSESSAHGIGPSAMDNKPPGQNPALQNATGQNATGQNAASESRTGQNATRPGAELHEDEASRKACLLQFDASWQRGERPQLTEFLLRLPKSQREVGLRELLICEIGYRRRFDEVPLWSDYAEIPPEYQSVVADVLAEDDVVHRAATTISDPSDTAADALPVRAASSQHATSRTPLEPSTDSAANRIGDYEIINEIARGGMGVVYKARHSKLGRMAAVKLIKSGELADEAQVRRFQIEGQAAAELDHPGIVPVYDIGQKDNQHYLAMAFIDGQTLWQQIKESPLQPKLAAKLMKQVAEAIHYAHQRGIIHRDLKPQNIILTKEGQPKVADFGLAKRQETDSSLTGTGQVLGTPSYMPPEQVNGKHNEIGPLSDVYSLGATLYCLLTGRPPFQAATAINTMLQVLEQEPVSPRSLNQGISVDLETICLKCLQKEQAKRYRSARALADDLDRYLLGEPILARPVGQLERLWRWSRRNPVVAGSISVVGLLLVVVATVSTLAYLRETALVVEKDKLVVLEKDARKKANDNEVLANRRADELAGELYRSQLAHASAEIAAGDLASAEVTLDKIPASRRRFWEYKYLKRQTAGTPMVFHGHQNAVTALQFSVDGKRLVSGSLDAAVKVWDVTSGELLTTLDEHSDKVHSIAISPDGLQLATASHDQTIMLWRLNTGTLLYALTGRESIVRDLAFSPDGKRLVSCADNGTVKLWNPETGQEVSTIQRDEESRSYSIAYIPDGSQIVAGGKKLWMFDAASPNGRIERFPMTGSGLELSPDGRRIATKQNDTRAAQIQDLVTGSVVCRLPQHTQQIYSLAYRPDGRWIASASGDRTVKLCDANTGAELRQLRADSEFDAVVFSPDGYLLATGSRDGTVRLWDIGSEEADRLKGHTSEIWSVSADSTGKTLVSGAGDGVIKVWDTDTQTEKTAPQGADVGSDYVRFSPDGTMLAIAEGVESSDRADDRSRQWQIKMWNLDRPDSPMVIRAPGPDEGATGSEPLAFAPSGKIIANGRTDGAINLWNLDSRSIRMILQGHTNQVRSVEFSPDGKSLASGSNDKTAKVWDAESGECLQTLTGHSDFVWTVTYNRDGTQLASTSLDHTVNIWNPQSGQLLKTLRGHSSVVPTAAFCPNEPRIATGSMDGTARIWDVESGETLLTLRGHQGFVLSLCFSPDGTRLYTASNDGTIRVWDTRLPFERSILRGHADNVLYAEYSKDGTRLVTTDESDKRLVWRLPDGELLASESPPAESELQDESSDPQLQAIPLANTVVVVRRIEGYNPWRLATERRRKLLPDWHTADALRAEEAQDWYAAAFHLSHVIKYRPDDADAKRRYDQATAKLMKQGIVPPK